MLDGVRKHLAFPEQESTSIADRDLIEPYVERVVVKPQALELCLLLPREVSMSGEETNTSDSDTGPITTKLTLAWTPQASLPNSQS